MRPPTVPGQPLQELLNKHLQERPIAITMHNKLVTQEFSDLTLKMIMKRPADRLSSLHEFLTRFRSVRIFQDDPGLSNSGKPPVLNGIRRGGCWAARALESSRAG